MPTTVSYSVSVDNASGTAVRSIGSYRKSAGTYSATWNGKNNSGNIVPNGAYSILIKTTNSYPRVSTGTGSVTVTSTTTPPPPPPPTGTINSVQTIINDMTLPPDGLPHGVPTSWDWATHAEIDMGNNPGTFKAMTAWGQTYIASTGNPATNTRVNIRNIQAYVLSKSDGKWHQLQSSALVQGDYYLEDFSGDVSITGDQRTESDGTISVIPGNGYNFHYWPPNGRATINPTDIAAIFTTCQARLIVNNPALPDDRSTARFLLDMGGDYWLSLTAAWAPNEANNNDIGMGRFKWVTNNWQAFNMTTATAAQLQATPPPLQ